MGSQVCPDDGHTPSPTPHNPHRALEATELAGGLWWLCVAGDPERLAYGTWGTREKAEKARDWMIDRWEIANEARQERDRGQSHG